MTASSSAEKDVPQRSMTMVKFLQKDCMSGFERMRCISHRIVCLN